MAALHMHTTSNNDVIDAQYFLPASQVAVDQCCAYMCLILRHSFPEPYLGVC